MCMMVGLLMNSKHNTELSPSIAQPQPLLSLPFLSVLCLSLSQAGVRATAAQPAKTHVAASQRPVLGVSTPSHEGYAEDRECAVV